MLILYDYMCLLIFIIINILVYIFHNSQELFVKKEYNYFRTTGDKRTLGDMSLLEDSIITSARLTPTKYSTSHTYGIPYD